MLEGHLFLPMIWGVLAQDSGIGESPELGVPGLVLA